MARFVDVHSHVVPSGDDGARSIGDGLELCADAAEHGTGLLFATPHVWPALPLTVERERAVRASLDEFGLKVARRNGIARRHRHELLAPAEEERAGVDDQRPGAQLA